MTLTDEELDREWKPNGRRPQSCVCPYSSDTYSSEIRTAGKTQD
jgi:hypothetical protein